MIVDIQLQPYWVSLFTREWIEIVLTSSDGIANTRLPLYEGVD